MKRLYDDNLYRFDAPQASYWEATADPVAFDDSSFSGTDSCDVAIIGGGYTGLSAALHLARDYGIDSRVLEAGHFGWGASGRNGGFCCLGGTGIGRGELIRRFGLENARSYARSQVDAVELVRALGSDESIDYQPQGTVEVEVAHTKRAFKSLQEDYELMTGALGINADLYSADECREHFYDSTETYGGLATGPTFGLHPLRYCRGLATAAARRGAQLYRHSEVIEWSKDGSGRHRLTTRDGTLRAKQVVLAANGFLPESLHGEFFGRTIPVISAIIVTRPMSDDERLAHNWVTENPAANSRRVLNYYRMLPDNRFLFGGRGIAGSPSGERRTYEFLRRTLGRIWPKWRDIDVEYCWHGLICMTSSWCPSIGHLDDDNSVFFGFGYHGNGVNTATWTGKQLADWIGKGREPDGLPALVRGLCRRYPLPGLRRSYLAAGIFAARQLDRFG